MQANSFVFKTFRRLKIPNSSLLVASNFGSQPYVRSLETSVLWLRASHCTDYRVTSLLFLRVTCPCSLRTYATLKFIRSWSSSSCRTIGLMQNIQLANFFQLNNHYSHTFQEIGNVLKLRNVVLAATIQQQQFHDFDVLFRHSDHECNCVQCDPNLFFVNYLGYRSDLVSHRVLIKLYGQLWHLPLCPLKHSV